MLTPAAKGMGGAVMKAEQIVAGLGDKGAPPQPPQQLAPAPDSSSQGRSTNGAPGPSTDG